jgi:hypothetical protein
MINRLSLLVVMLVATVSGCMRSRDTIALSEEVAYMRFQGDVRGVALILDEGPEVDLDAKPGKDVRYEVKPGRHLVVLVRDGQAIVRRDLFVTRGQVIDMRVPQ